MPIGRAIHKGVAIRGILLGIITAIIHGMIPGIMTHGIMILGTMVVAGDGHGTGAITTLGTMDGIILTIIPGAIADRIIVAAM